MTREEKIKILSLIIENMDGEEFEWYVERFLEKENIDTANIINSEEMYDDMCWGFHDLVDNSMRLYLKLITIPSRTVETLEVGDYVEFEYADNRVFIKGLFNYNNGDSFTLQGSHFYFKKEMIHNFKAFNPHEIIEIIQKVRE